MQAIIEQYQRKHGYTPSVHELYNLYTQGELSLTDAQENELLKEAGL